jgi:hypothetical protein
MKFTSFLTFDRVVRERLTYGDWTSSENPNLNMRIDSVGYYLSIAESGTPNSLCPDQGREFV